VTGSNRDFRTCSTRSLSRCAGSLSWAELVSTSIGRMGIDAIGDEAGFIGQLTTWQIGCLQFVRAQSRGVSVRARSLCDREARRRPANLWIGICLDGSYTVASGGNVTEVGPERITIFGGARSRTVTFAESCDLLWVKIPRLLFPTQLPDEDHTAIDSSRGAGYLVQHLFRGIINTAQEPDLGDTAAVADGVVRLVSAMVTRHKQNDEIGSTHRSIALQRIKQHIEQNLSSDAICPQSVADALGMGPRYINKLFEGERTSLMRWTWSRRLERARLALQRGDQSSMSELAYGLGFKNQSHFSRAFKARYGYPPSRTNQRVADQSPLSSRALMLPDHESTRGCQTSADRGHRLARDSLK